MIGVADLMAALVAYLRARPAVTALTAQRVFGLELPAAETAHMPRAALVLRPSGGVAPGYTQTLPLERMRLDVVSYNATPFGAQALRRVVRDEMRRINRAISAGVLIHSVELSGGLNSGRDADTLWPRVVEVYTALASETPA